MSLLLKDPFALLDYAVDWGELYLDNDLLAASSWSVKPVEAAGLAVVSDGFEPTVATVKVSGGAPGKVYELTNHAIFASGREDRRSIQVRVETR